MAAPISRLTTAYGRPGFRRAARVHRQRVARRSASRSSSRRRKLSSGWRSMRRGRIDRRPAIDDAALEPSCFSSVSTHASIRSVAAASARRRSFRVRVNVFCCASTRDGDEALDMALHDASRDGAWRHVRPDGRRFSPLFGGRALAGAPLREDALRPGAAGAAYLEAFQAAGEPFFADVAEDTLQYVRRDMTAPEAASIPPRMPTACPAEKDDTQAHTDGGRILHVVEDEVEGGARPRLRTVVEAPLRACAERQRAIRSAE